MRKVCKIGVCEHRHVAQQLVAHVGLGRVQRHAVVPHVLRGEKNAEGEPIQKVARREQPTHGPHAEPGAAQQKSGNVLQLRHSVRAIAAVPLQQREHAIVRVNRKLPRVLAQLAVHHAPSGHLLRCVVNVRDGRAMLVARRGGHNVVAPLPVLGVMEAGVIRLQVRARVQGL